MKLTPYLNFDGNCREALDFYAANLGAKVLNMMTGDQMPGPNRPPAEFANRVMHARFELAGTTVMASDGPPGKTSPCAAPISPSPPTTTSRPNSSIKHSRKAATSS